VRILQGMSGHSLDSGIAHSYTFSMRSQGHISSRFSFAGILLIAPLLLLAGCGIGPAAPPSLVAIPTLNGHVMGGQQPLGDTTIKLYAVGALGNGSPAIDLLGTGTNGPATSVSSEADGSFAITGDYTCPVLAPSTPVYLTATGGNPGLMSGTDNTAIALVAALGPCNQLLANAATAYITINEATTAAAAWALSPFATSLTDIGASTTNLAGITEAFAIANQLVDTTTGNSPNSSVASYTSIETPKLYTLADIIATCVNTNGTDGTCGALFTDAKPPTVPSVIPTDTFAAALDIVQHPSNNVNKLFGLITGVPPFPALSGAPNDWTMTITYSHAIGPLTQAYISTIDQDGNLWGTYDYQQSILKFSPQFAPLVNVGLFPFDGTNQDPAFENTGRKTGVLSIDPSGDLWFATQFSEEYTTFQTTNATGAIFELDPNGNVLSTSTGYVNGGIVNPQTAMADTNGYIWVSNFGYYDDAMGNFYNLGGDVSLLSSSDTAESPSSGWNTSLSFLPGVINFDTNHNAWVTNSKNPNLLKFPATLTTGIGSSTADTATTLTIPNYASDIVFDTLNQGWFAYGSIGEINTSGAVANTVISSGSGLIYANELAIDASNRIWVYNENSASNSGYCPGITLSVFSGGSGGGAPLSTIALGSDISACTLIGPAGFLIDNAGSILVENVNAHGYSSGGFIYGYGDGAEGLTRFVGLATPTKTPNTGPPQAP